MGGSEMIELLGDGMRSPSDPDFESEVMLPGLQLNAELTPLHSLVRSYQLVYEANGMDRGFGLRSLDVVGLRCGRGGGRSGDEVPPCAPGNTGPERETAGRGTRLLGDDCECLCPPARPMKPVVWARARRGNGAVGVCPL
jgi:hypothetical protein